MPQRKVMIVGMDAATLDLIRPWAEQGLLPNFARVLREGAAGPLRSTVPVMSPAAWSTFATGTNPGKHGILDFTQMGPDSYKARFNNASRRRGATFWEIAGRQGIRSGVINVPITYPPQKFNGFQIAGMLSPGVNASMASSRDVFDDLREVCPEYIIDADMVSTAGLAAEEFLRRSLEMVERRTQAAIGLYRKHRPPLFVVAFVAADRASHYYWAYMEAARRGEAQDELTQRLGRGIQSVYQKHDEALGTLLAEAGEDTDVLIMSDHGAGPLRKGINMHKVLAAAGLLVEEKPGLWKRLKRRAVWAFARLAPASVKNSIKARMGNLAGQAASAVACVGVDYARSKAYPTGQSQGVFVNLIGRQPSGVVPMANYEKVRDEIIAALSELTDPETGAKVFRKVHRREELFRGPLVDQLPDVIAEQGDVTYDIPTFAENMGEEMFYELPPMDPARLHRHGGHTRSGLIAAIGPHIRHAEIDADIADVPATVLALLGCDIPDDFDGRVLSEMLTDDVAKPGKLTGEAAEPGQQSDYSADEQAEIEKRLKGLGYL